MQGIDDFAVTREIVDFTGSRAPSPAPRLLIEIVELLHLAPEVWILRIDLSIRDRFLELLDGVHIAARGTRRVGCLNGDYDEAEAHTLIIGKDRFATFAVPGPEGATSYAGPAATDVAGVHEVEGAGAVIPGKETLGVTLASLEGDVYFHGDIQISLGLGAKAEPVEEPRCPGVGSLENGRAIPILVPGPNFLAFKNTRSEADVAQLMLREFIVHYALKRVLRLCDLVSFGQ